MINYPFTFAYRAYINIKYRIYTHYQRWPRAYIYVYDLTPNSRARILQYVCMYKYTYLHSGKVLLRSCSSHRPRRQNHPAIIVLTKRWRYIYRDNNNMDAFVSVKQLYNMRNTRNLAVSPYLLPHRVFSQYLYTL